MRPFLRRVEPAPVRSVRHRILHVQQRRRAERFAAKPEFEYRRAWERRRDPKPTLEHIRSQACTAEQMRSPLYEELRQKLRMPPVMHRKYWEFAYVVRALENAHALEPGARGLGFAVGLEPLPAYFASRGCSVLATDLAPDKGSSADWRATGQHMSSKAALNSAGICEMDTFARLVDLRWVDMRGIDDDLHGFDFTWSSCAFEHLGSLEEGLRFVREQMRCLRPGGVSVHTTELNVSSDVDTLDSGDTVLFRRRDIKELADALRSEGHSVAPITFRLGATKDDRDVLLPPYAQVSPHLKIRVGMFVTTSFGLTITKGGAA